MWSGGMPATFGSSTVGNYLYSIYATYSTASGNADTPTPAPATKSLGNTTVFTGVATAMNRRAVPYTMSEAGQLLNISIYHNGGSGQMLLGVYSDSSNRPGARLGVTNAVTVNGSAGWQTVALQSPVSVAAGQRVWLAWVLQNSVGIRATSGTPGRAEAGATWSGGMPTTFGSSTVGNYIYSIYATYRPGTTAAMGVLSTVESLLKQFADTAGETADTLAVSQSDPAAISAADEKPEAACAARVLGRALDLGQGISVDQTGRNQGGPATVADAQGNTWVLWHAGDAGERQVYAASFFWGLNCLEARCS
jgi:hypothetical protein